MSPDLDSVLVKISTPDKLPLGKRLGLEAHMTRTLELRPPPQYGLTVRTKGERKVSERKGVRLYSVWRMSRS